MSLAGCERPYYSSLFGAAHSIQKETDYVCPAMARVFGLRSEFEASLLTVDLQFLRLDPREQTYVSQAMREDSSDCTGYAGVEDAMPGCGFSERDSSVFRDPSCCMVRQADGVHDATKGLEGEPMTCAWGPRDRPSILRRDGVRAENKAVHSVHRIRFSKSVEVACSDEHFSPGKWSVGEAQLPEGDGQVGWVSGFCLANLQPCCIEGGSLSTPHAGLFPKSSVRTEALPLRSQGKSNLLLQSSTADNLVRSAPASKVPTRPFGSMSDIALFPSDMDNPALRDVQVSALPGFCGHRTIGIVGQTAQQDKYCIFSVTSQVQVRMLPRGWSVSQLLSEVQSLYPTMRAVRFLTHRLSGFPATQLAITLHDAPSGQQALPVDYRPMGGKVCTIYAGPGQTAVEVAELCHSLCPSRRLPRYLYVLYAPDGTDLEVIPQLIEDMDYVKAGQPRFAEFPAVGLEDEGTALLQTAEPTLTGTQAKRDVAGAVSPHGIPAQRTGCPVPLDHPWHSPSLKPVHPVGSTAFLPPAEKQYCQDEDVALPITRPGGAPSQSRAPTLIHDLQAMIASHIPLRPAWIQGPLLHMSPFEARWLAAFFPEGPDRRRYTVFECRLDLMSHASDPSWSLLDYVTAATRSVPYRVRLVWYITRPISDLPVPQFALTAQSAEPGARAIPVDLRGMGGMLHTIELQSGPLSSIWAALRHKGVDPTGLVEQAWVDGVCAFNDEQGQPVTSFNADGSSPEWLQLLTATNPGRILRGSGAGSACSPTHAFHHDDGYRQTTSW